MPLSDIYRTRTSSFGPFGASTISSDLSLGQENDNGVFELVWENGQVKTNLQSNKAKQTPTHQCSPSLPSIVKLNKDNGIAAKSRISFAHNDISMSVSTSENVDPWFDCPTDDSLPPEYYLDMLPDLPQVPLNEFPNPSKGNVQNLESGFSQELIEKEDSVRDTSIVNFFHFAQPSALFKDDLQSAGAKEVSHLPNNGGKDIAFAASSPSPVCSILNSFNPVTRKEINSRPQLKQIVANVQESVSKTITSYPFWKQEGIPKESPTVEESTNQLLCTSFCETGPRGKKSRYQVVASCSTDSGNSIDGTTEDTKCDRKRKSRENEESEGRSDDVEEESVGFKKPALARASTGSRRSRAAEVHNLSERRRRDRINEKMRALQELIPNCNKVDKASMLDEAIEYLKTLQLQVQIMSMGVGYYAQPMMFQPGIQPIQPTQMAHFPRMGLAMGAGLGMGSFEVNGFSPACPIFQPSHSQGAHFSDPACFSRSSTAHNLQSLGFQCQWFPFPMSHASSIPMPTCDPVKSSIDTNAFEVTGIPEASETAPNLRRNVNSGAIQDPSCKLNSIHKQTCFQL